MNHPNTSSTTDSNSTAFIRKLWRFLNRDIRTFKWWGQGTKTSESDYSSLPEVHGDAGAQKVAEVDIRSEVDPRKIVSLRFRRDVLDWRDDFHFNVTEAASQAKSRLASQIENDLSNIGFLRNRLFKKSAREVLEDHIESCVRSPMRQALQLEQVALGRRLQGWLPNRHESVSIWIMWPKLEWDTRLDLNFTVENRDEILNTLQDLILGINGLADRHRHWANQYSTQIMAMRHVVSDSL